MKRRIGLTGAALVAAVALAGCGNRNAEPKLLNLRSTTGGPDEFSILPTKPLEAPKDFASLPPPTPGGKNLTDPTPDEDVASALGGNPAALNRTGIPGTDGALVSYASRSGVSGDIRTQLASEDLEFRKNNRGRLLERIFNKSVYFQSYKPQELDQYRELERFRRAGVKTPAAPPDPVIYER